MSNKSIVRGNHPPRREYYIFIESLLGGIALKRQNYPKCGSRPYFTFDANLSAHQFYKTLG
jgi:hypothetical protein